MKVDKSIRTKIFKRACSYRLRDEMLLLLYGIDVWREIVFMCEQEPPDTLSYICNQLLVCSLRDCHALEYVDRSWEGPSTPEPEF
jgi:hypothetical protein